MSDPYIGEIRLFTGNFAPRQWQYCAGQILSIAQNSALFSLLGTNYGGNGQTTFALPDLRGRVPVGAGQGPGLPAVALGEVAGTETVTLLSSQMPAHTHNLLVGTSAGNTATPSSSTVLSAVGPTGAPSPYAPLNDAAGSMSNALSVTGANLPHENMQPYLGVSYIIAVEGIFPSRN